MHRAIQFIGTQRSGSNLLRIILNQHRDISAPHPPHLLHTFVPLVPYYKEKYSNWIYSLTHDMCHWVKLNPVPWTKVQLDAASISKKAAHIFDIVQAIYQAKAQADNAKIWCCKSTFNVHYLPEIEKHYQPFYIHLYRDGRDVAVSFKKAYVGPKHVYFIARQWVKEQELSVNFLKEIPEHRKFSLSYEALLANPVEVVKRLCEKMQIQFDPAMLEYYKSEESIHTAEAGSMWEHVKDPILRNNSGKFLKELSSEEIAIFENVASGMLRLLGYEIINKSENNIPIDEPAFRKINDELCKAVKNNASVTEKIKRKPQEEFINEIKMRLGVLSPVNSAAF